MTLHAALLRRAAEKAGPGHGTLKPRPHFPAIAPDDGASERTPMAKPRRRTAAKIVTKREQTELMAHASRLTDDPTPLVPVTGGRRPRAIDKLERRLHKVAKRRDNPRMLRWALRRGPVLARAYANLVLVGHGGKAERMASMGTPVGELKYAVRGQVPRRPIVAVQHFRYPEVRILGYRELAKETNGVIWATETGTAYTGHHDPPPDDWFALVFPKLPMSFTREGDDLRCPHFVGIEKTHEPRAPAGLAITLATGPTRFLLCRECIDDHFAGDKGLLARLATYLIGLRPDKDIHLETTGTPTSCVHEEACSWVRHLPEPDKRILERYRTGGLNEARLLEEIRPTWTEAVEQADERLLVAGDHCYGDDLERYLDALDLKGDLREAVAAFVEAGPRVVIAEERSVNKVLEACWSAAPKVLPRLHPDPDKLDAMLARHTRSPPMAILQEIIDARQAAVALKGYPYYEGLQGGAATAERLATAHRIGGTAQMIETADRELKRSTHKGIVWAALRIAGATQTREWQFDRTDQDAGEFLEAPMQALLDADADGHHDALAQVHTLSGGTGDLSPPSGKH